MDADDVGHEQVDGLPEHPGLRLDPPDSPSHDAHAVDHGRVRVRPHESVREVDPGAFDDAERQPFHVDLVDDPDARRDNLEAVKRLRPPLQELVPRAVPPELDLHVQPERIGRRPVVDLHRVVHHERHRHERLDHGGILAHPFHRGAHGREVDEQGHAGEVLEDDAGDDERNFGRPLGVRLPVGQLDDILLPHPSPVQVAEQGLEDDPQADGQPGNAPDPIFLQARERVEFSRPTRAEGEGLARAEGRHRVAVHREKETIARFAVYGRLNEVVKESPGNCRKGDST